MSGSPERSSKLIVGDLAALPGSARYELVIGIQVFQHGTPRAQAHQHLLAAAERVPAGGLLCVRVNATETDIEHDHDRIEDAADDGFTIRYSSGPKRASTSTSSPPPNSAPWLVTGSRTLRRQPAESGHIGDRDVSRSDFV